jgi:multiple sugar transport system substrate-binding protein
MKKQNLLKLSGVALALGALCSCASSTSESKSKGSGEEEDVTIRLVANSDAEDYMEEVIELFNMQYPHINVEAMYGTDYMMMLDTKSPADLIYEGNVSLTTVKHLFCDLNDVLAGEFDSESEYQKFVSQFASASIDSMRRDGKLLMLPVTCNVSLFYYNKTIFDANKSKVIDALNGDPDRKEKLTYEDSCYPNDTWTWDDYSNVGQALTVIEGGAVKQWGSSTISNWWGEYLIYIRQSGGDFFKEDGKTPAFDTEAFKTGMEFMKSKVSGARKFAPNPFSTAGGNDALGGFTGGKTAMEMGGHTGNWYTYNQLSFDWDAAPLPRPKKADGTIDADARGGELASEGYGIYSGSAHKSEAAKFLKFLYSDDVLKVNAKVGKLTPTTSYRAILEKAGANGLPNLDAVYTEMDRALPLPEHQYFSGAAQEPFTSKMGKYFKDEYATFDDFVTDVTNSVDRYLAYQN